MSDGWPAAKTLANGALLVASPILRAQGELLADEQQLLLDARPARCREIIAGRTIARRAMSLLGIPQTAVLMNANGAPKWPVGICGSIAHSPQHIAVVLAESRALRSIGVDIEDGRELGEATANIASAADITAVSRLWNSPERETASRLVFSAKEALFKCQAPLTGNMDLDFDEIVLIGRPEGTLGAKYHRTAGTVDMSAIKEISIYFEEIQGLKIVTAIIRS